MIWLTAAAVLSLLFGLLLLLSGEKLKQLSAVFNQPVAYIDTAFIAARIPVGLSLIMAGGWLISVAAGYPALWLLAPAGALAVGFGLLFFFLPGALNSLAKSTDTLFFPADDFSPGARRGLGIILIIAAVYIFFAASYFLR